MERTWLGVLGLAVMFAVCKSGGCAAQGVQTLRNLPYVANGHEQQRLDIDPAPETHRPAAAGCADPRRGMGKREAKKIARPCRWSARATPWPAINYRLSQHALFPARSRTARRPSAGCGPTPPSIISTPTTSASGIFGRRAPGRLVGHHRRRERVRGQGRQPRPV